MDNKIHVLLDLKSDKSYEISEDAINILSKISAKKISVVNLIGYNQSEIIPTLIGIQSLSQLFSESNSIYENSLLFSVNETKEFAIVYLYTINSHDYLIKIASNFIASTIVLNIGSNEINEKEIVQQISLLQNCSLHEGDTKEPALHSIHEFLPKIIFIANSPESVQFKSEFLSNQAISKLVINSSNIKDLSKHYFPKKYKNFYFDGDSIVALIVSK